MKRPRPRRPTLPFVAVVAGLLFLVPSGTDADAAVVRQAWARTGMLTTFVAAEGGLYVTATAGSEETRSYIELGGSPAPGSTLVLHELDAGLQSTDAAMFACALASPVPADGQVQGPLPPEDCTVRAPVSRAADGSWAVPLTVFVDRWAGGGPVGVVLLPDLEGTARTFRVALDRAKTALSSPPADPTTTTTTEPEPPPFDEGAAIDEGTTGFDGAAPVEAPPTPTTVPVGAPPGLVAAADPPLQRAAAASTPSSLVVLFVLLLLGTLGVAASPLRRRIEAPRMGPMAHHLSAPSTWRVTGPVVATLLALLPMLGSEVVVFKAGVVLVFFVGVLGLHILVNWAGELSLAQAGMVGLPAFVVLAVSAVADVSPVYLLPLGVLVGAATGALLGLPALRTKGLQVALVTLVAGVGIDRFFFAQTWLVGKVSRVAATPSLGPLDMSTSRSRYPFLLAVLALAVAACTLLYRSKVARAWFWVRANPDAAAAFGIPVLAYRLLAYVVCGAFAGLAGGLYAMWVESFGREAFPLQLSFTYLLVAVLGGPGFLAGVAAAAVFVQGGPLFASEGFGAGVGGAMETVVAYGGPVGLIAVITRFEGGLNGIGRSVMQRLHRSSRTAADEARGAPPEPISLALLGGTACVVAGFVAIALAWYHAGNTDRLFVQVQELISGGIGGLGLILVGSALLIRDRLSALARPVERTAEASAPVALPAVDAVAANGRVRRTRSPEAVGR